ncbi:hypothetical protein M9H77_07182 [Catharanthus roseus]|uniref:Uncharacterized protein n=1 Tax=Catharanthus roseus TaxID=4058 RepID=A0ACC0BUG6_CATRO|nr:hypothetical protein M9H77_07182 [Catharanthus roseus]
MIAIFEGLVGDIMEVFMDDFSFCGSSFDACLLNLERVLKGCEEIHIVLNWEKCHFMVQERIVLGHKISESSIDVDRDKIETIERLPLPSSVKAIRNFLGHAATFNLIKEKLTKSPILVSPNWSIPFELMCDTSDYAIGVMLG